MNFITIAKFLHIICNTIFISLFGAGQIKRGFLEPISNYFAIVEINGYKILHLHCFIWLNGVLHLVTLQTQILSDDKFCHKLLLFLEYIIKCLASENPHPEILDQTCPNVNDLINTSQFADLLRSDSEVVAQKV